MTMRLLRYDAPKKYVSPAHTIGFARDERGRRNGVRVQHGMRVAVWFWRLTK